MVLTKFIVHSASHQANTNSSLNLSQIREKLVHEENFELERTEKFSSNFLRNICNWRTLSLFLNFDLLNKKHVAQLMCDSRASTQVTQL